jgi:hypothetical protein
MSSGYVRLQINTFLEANWTTTEIFYVDDYDSIDSIPANNTGAWVGVEYPTSVEQVNSIPANFWREDGDVLIHIVTPNGWNSATPVSYGDQLQQLLRGQRLGDVVIESVSPVTDASPPALELSSSWHGWAILVSYYSIRSSS